VQVEQALRLPVPAQDGPQPPARSRARVGLGEVALVLGIGHPLPAVPGARALLVVVAVEAVVAVLRVVLDDVVVAVCVLELVAVVVVMVEVVTVVVVLVVCEPGGEGRRDEGARVAERDLEAVHAADALAAVRGAREAEDERGVARDRD